MQFNDLLDGKTTRDKVAKALADQAFVTREDRKRGVVLYPKEVKEMDLVCRVRASRLDEEKLDEVGRDNWLQPDVLGKIEDLRGEVIDGKHTGLFQTNYIPDALREELRQQVWGMIGDKSARLPVDGETSIPVHLDALRRLRVYLKLQVEIKDVSRPDAGSPGPDWTALREQTDKDWKAKAKEARICDKAKDERNFEATVRLANPPPVLSAKLRKLMQADPAAGLSAKVEAVVDKRRVALLLFRQ